jgi:hypothetical protein
MNKKVVAGFEVVLMTLSFFAFGYFAGLNEIGFVSAKEDVVSNGMQGFQDWLDSFDNSVLTVESSWNSYALSTSAEDIGCCFVNVDGQACGSASPENCADDSPFAEGVLCSETSFCEKGCCYDDASGVYDANVLEVACSADWVDDSNCNLPRANLGCCVLGSDAVFETEGQCEVDSLARALGEDGFVDWREGVGEVECLMLGETQEEGACVLANGGCRFESEVECVSKEGDFYVDTLCTSPSLNTSCVMTEQTKCVSGKDEVYFVDSCGNLGNVYDSARVDDLNYWDEVVEYEDLCGAGEGNGGSDDCGNCNRFLGGACGAAGGSDVGIGGFKCVEVGCEFEGESYENGESWCVYDGAIGNGNDLPGSRHWKAVCSQGQTKIEPCADYRNQICIQSDGFEIDGEDVDFNNAACVANNWRECISLNENEDSLKECGNTLNCRIDKIEVTPDFTFDACLPKYPAGFDLNSERYQASAEPLCGIATTNCTVVQKPKFFGGCSYVANEGCLEEEFGQEMNDFCRGLGDCGGSVNIAGEWSGNYRIKESPDLSSSWISKLSDLVNPVAGDFAEVEDYSEYLAAAGILDVSDAGGSGEFDITGVATGVGGIGMAAGFAAGYLPGAAVAVTETSIAVGASGVSAGAAAFAGVAMGAAIGMVLGGMLAKSLGLSKGGSMLMAVGGGLVGAGVSLVYFEVFSSLSFIGPYAIAIGAVLILIGSLFGGRDCDPIEVQFECKPWQPPVGGADCGECNGDPLKPCSEYRCESLGAGCTLLNVGTGDELCVDGNPNDVTPPVITRSGDDSSGNVTYVDGANGVSIVSAEGGCLDANTFLTFGVVTNEPSQCRFDGEASTEFKDMEFDLGGNSYLYNHTTSFLLPDPSHGQSQGWNWSGNLSLFVKCSDRNGIVSLGNYEVNMCVFEGEDITPPIINGDVSSGDILAGFDAVNQDIEIVTNELSSCRWDLNDVNYSLMNNDMECGDSLGRPSNANGYVCNDVVPIGNGTRDYYVRCVDQPWLSESERNANELSYVFTIRKPESKISITDIKPDSDYEVSTDLTTVDLRIGTTGGGNSHFCSYSFSGYDTMFDILETGALRTHSIDLNMAPGEQKIYVECRDETGDFDRGLTSFEIIQDVSSPAIARIWQEENNLNFVTLDSGECKYSIETCRFAWSEGASAGVGMEHNINVVRGETYYIRCADEFGNMPNGCSVEVVAT